MCPEHNVWSMISTECVYIRYCRFIFIFTTVFLSKCKKCAYWLCFHHEAQGVCLIIAIAF